jgi:hypothetical protein
MLRTTLALILATHGVGHTLGLLQLSGIAVVSPAWTGDSWLLAGPVASVAGVVAAVIWMAAVAGFAGVAAILLGWLPEAWWASVAIGAALVSLAGLALFPSAFPVTSSMAALVVDAILLVAVVVAKWTPSRLPPA